MSVFAHKTDKGKFILGNETDLNGIADGTAFNSIKALAGMIAGIENGATASKTYNAGEYILRNGSLYRVTTTIASGTVITVGVNIEEATIGGELAEIKSDLDDIFKIGTTVTALSDNTPYTATTNGVVRMQVGSTLSAIRIARVTVFQSSSEGDMFAWKCNKGDIITPIIGTGGSCVFIN